MADLICPNCGRPVYDGEALFCHFCGESLRRAGGGLFGTLKYGRFKFVLVFVAVLVLLMFLIWAGF